MTVAGHCRIPTKIFRFQPVQEYGLSDPGQMAGNLAKYCRILAMIDCMSVKVDCVYYMGKMIYAFKKRKSFFEIY
jgi:hypothetical protein